MNDKKAAAEWLGRPILDPEHSADLETRAAIHEFHNKLPRSEAESKAHEDYMKDQRERAAAHHLAGMRAANAVGDKESARKHWLMYDTHARALGHDSIGAVPHEVEAKMEAEPSKLYRFKAHKADIFSANDHKDKEEPVAKAEKGAMDMTGPIPLNLNQIPEGLSLAEKSAEAKQCKWRLGERRCRRATTKGYCHDHEGHWANKIKQKEDSMSKDVKKAEPLSKPPVSEAQRRAMAAAAHGNSTLGIPKSVGKDFIEADSGKKLPETKKDELPATKTGAYGLLVAPPNIVPFANSSREKPAVVQDINNARYLQEIQNRAMGEPVVPQAPVPLAAKPVLPKPAIAIMVKAALPTVAPKIAPLAAPKPAHAAPPPAAPASAAPPPAAPASAAPPPAAPALHSSVDSFMGALKAMPKGTPARGKFITAHMNHPPFLAALQSHPQGKQMHAQLTQFLNSPANAGFKAGGTKVVAKSEAEESAKEILKAVAELAKDLLNKHGK